ncbi:MAG: DNRLRE domain-containing protein [Thermoproteota archaeon]
MLSVLFLNLVVSFYVIEAEETPLILKRFYPSDDATVAGCCLNNNYGGLENLTISAGASTNDVCRVFIKFNDLNRIPPGSVIDSAFLYLYVYGAPSLRRQIYCYRVTGANWTESTITWRNQPDAVELVASEVVPTTPRWLGLDLKESVAKFASKDASSYVPNYGWRLSDKDESNSSEVFTYCFYSNESSVDLNPFLEVKYYPPHLDLKVLSSSTIAGTWIRMEVSRRTRGNEPITSGNLRVVLSSSSTKKRFSLSDGGEPITELVISHGSDSKEFWYYDENEGTCRLYARTEDYPNYGGGSISITLTPKPRDTSPPVSTIVIGVPKHQSGDVLYVSGSTGFSLSATDDASGVSRTKYRVDDNSWDTYTEEFTLTDYPDGLHTLEYYSVDNVGNNETTKALLVYLDKVPPTISDANPVGSITRESASVNLTVKVEDADSGVKEVRLTVDGTSQGVMMPSGGVYTKAVSLSEGSHTWSIEALDNVDNVASQSYSFTLTVSGGLSSVWLYGVIAAIVIIIVVVIMALALRKKKT